MIKLVAADLDNTLLDEEKKLPDSTVKVIQRAMIGGVQFVPATGRAFPSAQAVAKKLGSTSPVICYNGSMVRSLEGDIIFAEYIGREVVELFVDFCTRKGIYLQIYHDDFILVEKKQVSLHDDPDMEYTTCREVGDFYSIEIKPSPKLLLAAQAERIPLIMEELKERFSSKVYLSQSDAHLIEVTPLSSNKGRALERVQDFLGIENRETMACGDNTNDEFLLKSAGIGVAVANAVPELKKVATYICRKERSLGVEEAIHKFILKE